jgi:hypothetical protein
MIKNIEREFQILGIIGLINLITGRHLIVATKGVSVGKINDQDICQLTGFMIIQYIPFPLLLTEARRQCNEKYLSMIKEVLETPYLYFSSSYDITHTLQRFHSMSRNQLQQSLLERADQRFFWNRNLLKSYQDMKVHKYCLPLLFGCKFSIKFFKIIKNIKSLSVISINKVTINGHTFSWILISRRSTRRAGTRLFCRGIDVIGNVANFVETEQIVEFNEEKISFVQIRGSIPMFWSQTPNLRLNPKPKLDPNLFLSLHKKLLKSLLAF